MIEIVHRALTHNEAVRLHQELKTTPNILGYTVRELKRLSDVQIAEVNGGFVGICFCFDLAQNWTEIAALYVLPEFRGSGIGKMLFDKAWERVQSRQRHVYILSRNPQVIEWMGEHGMTVDTNMWHAPVAVHWFMVQYMASRHRYAEGFRKRRAIAQCPPLRQGIKKFVPSPIV